MTTKKTFNDLGLSAKALKAINSKGFEVPTEIQVMTIPLMLRDDTNIIAQAQTGTGKTAAFGLPLIELIDTGSKSVQAIILVPTRELAIQVSEEISSLKVDKNLKIIPIYGGQAIDQQLRKLKKGVHIVVGTPGRVIDHLKRKTLKLHNIEHLILDEADEMLNMGFIDDIEKIMKHTNPDKRTLLFSATLPGRIKQLARKYMDDYELLVVKNEPITTNLTDQIYFEVKASDKFEALCRIIDIENEFYSLVFCRTKKDVDQVSTRLSNRGYDADCIHGGLTQAQREKTLEKFKKKRVTILVATDVAARGIDVIDLTHVINYSLPHDPEAYIHRIGRTGRAGKEGTAITFITPEEYRQLMHIKKVIKTDIRKEKLPKSDEILNAKKYKVMDNINKLVSEDVPDEFYQMAKDILADNKPKQALAAILHYAFQEELGQKYYNEIRDVHPHISGKTRLFVSKGKKHNMTKRKLVEFIIRKANTDERKIDDVQVFDTFSFITVPFTEAEIILKCFKKSKKGDRSVVERAKKEKK